MSVAMLLFLCVIPPVAQGDTLSKVEVDALWEQLLVEERYEAIWYIYRSSQPNVFQFPSHRELVVQETREGLFWGLFGSLGTGGGWEIRGQLEAEVPSPPGMIQLYSKASSNWSPGFAFVWMPGYDGKKYPIWEFRLVLRSTKDRRKVRKLKSIEFGPGDVVSTVNEDGSAIKEFIGQRVPRGELTYDQTRGIAIVRILGLRAPMTLEAPIDGR
jgi:hypothetical protein